MCRQRVELLTLAACVTRVVCWCSEKTIEILGFDQGLPKPVIPIEGL